MARMEAVVARDDAVNESSLAQEKARAAQTKLQEMTDFVNKATKLKESNERLHVSLQDETEKRKKLHNTLEDLKGRIRVYVRVRPLSESEMKANYQVVMTKEDDRTCVMSSDAATCHGIYQMCVIGSLIRSSLEVRMMGILKTLYSKTRVFSLRWQLIFC